jgi:hypothetical protein
VIGKERALNSPTNTITHTSICERIQAGERPKVPLEEIMFTNLAQRRWSTPPALDIGAIVALCRSTSAKVNDATTIPIAKHGEKVVAAFGATWDIIHAPTVDGAKIETLGQAQNRLKLGENLLLGRLAIHAPMVTDAEKAMLKDAFKLQAKAHYNSVKTALKATLPFNPQKVEFVRGSER